MYALFILFLCFFNTWLITPVIVWFVNSKNTGIGLPKESASTILDMYSDPLSIFSTIVQDSDVRSAWLKLIIFSIIVGFLLILVLKNLNIGEQTGVNYLEKDGTQGTAKWMSIEDANKVLGIGTGEGLLFGTVKKEGLFALKKMVTLPPFSFLNRNVAIFGASGSMKSRSFVRPNIMQITQMVTKTGGKGQSMIITDPKGEIFESMAQFLRDKGYNVKVLNLVNMLNSDRWNPLAEVVDDISAQSFAETVMANTKAPGAKSNEFWDKTETNLLKALVLYVIKENRPENRNLAAVCSLLALNNAKAIDKIFDSLPKCHPAKMPYNVYCQAGDNVRGGVVIGLATKLQVFQSKLVQDLTATSDIDLTLPKKEKCAYFCITSDMESTFDFIAGLFFSFLFIKLTKYADYAPAQGQKDVIFILDEFPNIGAIPDFTKKISTMRSRGISSCVIFQNIAQLKNRYPNDGWSEIIGNCDSRLFLGATDSITAKFVSELLGVATVRSVSSKRKAGFDGVLDPGSLNISTQKRNLLNPDEILRLPHDNAILILKGQQPLLLKKMDYTKHKLSKDMKPIQVSDYKPEWTKEYYENLKEGKELEDILMEKEKLESQEHSKDSPITPDIPKKDSIHKVPQYKTSENKTTSDPVCNHPKKNTKKKTEDENQLKFRLDQNNDSIENLGNDPTSYW